MQKTKTVSLLFKTHLDIGFTDYASSVIRRYIEEFIPGAVNTAKMLREEGGEARMVWTLGSWMIWHYLEVAKGDKLKEMEEALLSGDISWHAMPFTMHTELLTPDLLCYGLSLSKSLDERFEKKTIAAKMTDVPGHTIGMVPILADAGVRMIHIGVNEASTPPDVPDRFVWKHPGGSELIVIYKGSYGGDMRFGDEVFRFAHTYDNKGPQSIDGVRLAFSEARKKYSPETLRAATLNDLAAAAFTEMNNLPVITAEIGDTWIHGTGSDPWKTVRMRALARLVDGRHDKKGTIDNVRDSLLLIAEHTWGMDEKTFLKNYWHYSKKDFIKLRKSEKCLRFENSWAEQRGYIENAASELEKTGLAESANEALEALKPSRYKTAGLRRLAEGMLSNRRFEFAFDFCTGALNYIKNKDTGRIWCSGGNRIGLFMYENFSGMDYARFARQYLRNLNKTWVWSLPDFTKPGIERLMLRHGRYLPEEVRIYSKGEIYIAEIRMPEEAVRKFGSPAGLQILYRFRAEEPCIEIMLQWFEKPACRIAEASWLSFSFDDTPTAGWFMDKLGTRVSPLDVVSKGARALHGIGRGVGYSNGGDAVNIISPDAHLVAFGAPSLLDFHNRVPEAGRGVFFNLHNNVWGTNFPMWHEDDARFRFIIEM